MENHGILLLLKSGNPVLIVCEVVVLSNKSVFKPIQLDAIYMYFCAFIVRFSQIFCNVG